MNVRWEHRVKNGKTHVGIGRSTQNAELLVVTVGDGEKTTAQAISIEEARVLQTMLARAIRQAVLARAVRSMEDAERLERLTAPETTKTADAGKPKK